MLNELYTFAEPVQVVPFSNLKWGKFTLLHTIVDRIGTINPQGFPMILTGDFNINPDNPALEYLNAEMESARDVAEKSDWHNTFNGWSTIKTDRIIDYIYFKGFDKCTEYQTIIKQYLNIPFVSDHYPIYAILKF